MTGYINEGAVPPAQVSPPLPHSFPPVSWKKIYVAITNELEYLVPLRIVRNPPRALRYYAYVLLERQPVSYIELTYSQISGLELRSNWIQAFHQKKKKNGSRLKEISTIPLKPTAAVRNLSKDMRMRSRLSGLLLEGRRMQLNFFFFFAFFQLLKSASFTKCFLHFAKGQQKHIFF